MRTAYRVELRPNATQQQAFLQHAGNARWAYNWGLRQKIDAIDARRGALAAGTPKAEAPKVPTAIDLHKTLNRLERLPEDQGRIPWMYSASKCAPQEALRDLDKAFGHFYRRCREGAARKGFPRFKSKSRGIGGFTLTKTPGIKVTPEGLELPTVGFVRFMPGERGYIPVASYGTAHVTEHAGRWFVSVLGEEHPEVRVSGPSVGIDVGVRALATLSDGTVFASPKPLNAAHRKLRRAQQALSRRQRGSANRAKARRRVARIHERVGNVRRDVLHEATTAIAKRYGLVVLEDLDVQRMTRKGGRRNRAVLTRAILDCGWGEFRRQLEYKGQLYGCLVHTVNPAYTSQTCSGCGARNDPGASKRYSCSSCGLEVDRDLNAAENILVAASSPETENACGADVSRGTTTPHPASKQESDGTTSQLCLF